MNDENIVERVGFSLFQYELFFFVFRAYIRLPGVLGRAFFFDSNRMLNGFERRKKKQHRLNRREATMKIMMKKERLGGTCA